MGGRAPGRPANAGGAPPFYLGTVSAPKSRNGRRDIPLSSAMATRLWAAQGAPDALIFTDKLGQRVDRDKVWGNVLKPAAKKAGVGWVGFHSFRHTCASLLFAAGKNLKQVQEWLGHYDPAFTLRTYVHLIDGGLGDADFLDEIVQADTEKRATQGATQATETGRKAATG